MSDPALEWAERLAEQLCPDSSLRFETRGETAANAWARSGGLWLTGPESCPPVLPSVPLPSCMDGAVAFIRALAPEAGLDDVNGAALLGEHAALAGLSRRGRTSPGGSARLLRAGDGWLVVNLPREEDRRCLPAWLGLEPAESLDPWPAVSAAVASRSAVDLVDRATLLGLAVAAVLPVGAGFEGAWLRVAAEGPSGAPKDTEPVVIDLSSLWAGPLCTDLLRRCGARVLKVESKSRPDGARRGPPAFFDLLNAGKENVQLDFDRASGRAALQRLINAADIVVEASRPRALEQLGIDAVAWIRKKPGRVWLSLTAYGLREGERERVGFGDDVAAAAGLVWSVPGAPLFVADAPADPLAGVHAAAAVLAARKTGTSRRLDISLRAVMSAVCALRSSPDEVPSEPIQKPRARAGIGKKGDALSANRIPAERESD